MLCSLPSGQVVDTITATSSSYSIETLNLESQKQLVTEKSDG